MIGSLFLTQNKVTQYIAVRVNGVTSGDKMLLQEEHITPKKKKSLNNDSERDGVSNCGCIQDVIFIYYVIFNDAVSNLHYMSQGCPTFLAKYHNHYCGLVHRTHNLQIRSQAAQHNLVGPHAAGWTPLI